MELDVARQTVLVEKLKSAGSWPHPVGTIESIETHISWVLLAGDYAYKIKKAVNFGFLDFSSLEKRRYFCREEVRLNRRTAPEIYLDVIPIGGSAASPIPGSAEGVIEYAVQMRRFPQEALLDRRLARGELTANQIDAVAEAIARFHSSAHVAASIEPFGTPEAVFAPVAQNFGQIRATLDNPQEASLLDLQEAKAAARFAALQATVRQRKRDGFVRECHGDLHLGNLADLDGRITLFDGIEFNPALRWIDVMNDLAFLLMDLESRERSDLSRRLLNGYLERTGDYAGVKLLDFYKHYRAMVRAKVAALRRAQASANIIERLALLERFGTCLALGGHYSRERRPLLLLTFGPSGSGKSRTAGALVEALDATVCLRSDVERKRLFNLQAAARSGSAPGGGIYTREANDRTYERLAELADGLLEAGYSAIVDAAFLERARRARFIALARERRLPVVILEMAAGEEMLRERVASRLAEGGDASEAGIAVLERQLTMREGLSDEERPLAVTVESGEPPQIERLVAAIRQKVDLFPEGTELSAMT